jgi:hypothetical protein
MASPKTTPVSPPAFSTILTACGIDRFSRNIDADGAEQEAQFQSTHGIGRKDWDTALSHLHEDLR